MKRYDVIENQFETINFDKLKKLMAEFEAVTTRKELTSILKDEALNRGYNVLGVLDYNPLSSSMYQLSSFGELEKELIAALDCDTSYQHCKSGLRIRPLGQIIEYINIECGLYLLPLRGVDGIVGGLVFDIPETVETFGNVELIDWYWTILSPYLLNAAMRCRENQINITKREKDCLKWACEGKTSWEISQILGIAERTVNFHLSNCIVKTDSANRQQAIVKCIVKNLI